MRPLGFHRDARNYLRRMPERRREQMLTTLREVADLEDPLAHPDVKNMSGNPAGRMRLRVGVYRAIFRLRQNNEGLEVLFVLTVNTRGDAY